jgi:hypothetical protein
MARVVLHIGPHKTGTTLLQQRFVALREPLGAAGIAYPEAWQRHLWGHHALAFELAAAARAEDEAERRLAAMRDTFAAVAAAAPCVLLSSENFERLSPAAIALLRRMLDGHAVEVVYFARRWSGLLPSVWQEDIKHGGAETLPAFALGHLLRPFRSEVLNYANVLDRYAAAFGAEALRFASYDAVLEGGGTLLGFFLGRVLGVALPPDGAAERVNGALPPEDAEIIRVLNAMARRERGRAPGGAWPRTHFHALARDGHPAVAALRGALRQAVEALRIPDDTAPFRAVERAVLERHGTRLLNAAPDGRLFGPCAAPAEIRHVAGDPWTLPGVPDAFAALHRAIGERHRATRPAAA